MAEQAAQRQQEQQRQEQDVPARENEYEHGDHKTVKGETQVNISGEVAFRKSPG